LPPTEFQSTHPYRVRLSTHRRYAIGQRISIHAPVQGATIQCLNVGIVDNISIHAPVQGATDKSETADLSALISIHAPVQGATINLFHYWACRYLFQSTHPYRVRRARILGYSSTNSISIHAPVQGATKRPFAAVDRNLISIHAPVQGATAVSTIDNNYYCYFNPRTRTGCDGNRSIGKTHGVIFQSTHPYRVRLNCFNKW